MPVWFRQQGPAFETVVEKIMRYFHRVYRPVFLGEISIDIGLGLDRTEEYVKHLVEEGVLRAATREEILRADGREDSLIFVLVGPRELKMAHRP